MANIGEEELQVTETLTQVEKTYTQKELDDHSAKLKSSVAYKYEKKLADLGDLDELLKLREQSQKRAEDESLKRGEFDRVLQEKLSIKDSEIAKRDNVIREYKINTPLLASAATHRAINAEQVKALLSSNVRLNNEGDVEVIGTDGNIKYKDDGKQYSVDELVSEFLRNNTHFVSPGLATTHTKSNVNSSSSKLDITKLDMTNQKDRDVYRQYKKDNNIR